MKLANSEFINTPKQFVLIVGQNPSVKNYDQYIAFKGTQSGKRLDAWMEKLNIQNGNIINASQEIGAVNLKQADYKTIYFTIRSNPIDKVIALGNYASKVLTKMQIPHYKLPHPSGKARIHNNPEKVAELLNSCYNYLYGNEEINANKVSEEKIEVSSND